MAENNIVVTKGAILTEHNPEKLLDIVFVRRDPVTGKELYSFSLREVTVEADVQWTEQTVPVPSGEAGQGLWLITGDILLFQNDVYTINSLQQHIGQIYELHVLYGNGASIHSALVLGGLRKSLLGSGYDSIIQRFPMIEAHRNEYGVYLSLSEGSQGERSIHIKLSGATAEKINFLSTTDFFYTRFSTLDQSPPPILNQGG